ncbi:hypothetical protein ACLOJK_016703 [Asimina triloba]
MGVRRCERKKQRRRGKLPRGKQRFGFCEGADVSATLTGISSMIDRNRRTPVKEENVSFFLSPRPKENSHLEEKSSQLFMMTRGAGLSRRTTLSQIVFLETGRLTTSTPDNPVEGAHKNRSPGRMLFPNEEKRPRIDGFERADTKEAGGGNNAAPKPCLRHGDGQAEKMFQVIRKVMFRLPEGAAEAKNNFSEEKVKMWLLDQRS